jgi:ABC-type glycerol-3-phosphate transport system permease component
VIITVGYYVCQLDWGIAAKYWSIILLTVVSCLAFYFILIRPFAIMRILFGMKPQR